MSVKKLSIENTIEEPTRLDQCIFVLSSKKEEKLSKSFIRKLIILGAVYLNRKRCKIASRIVRRGDHIELFINSEKILTRKNIEHHHLRILYEDESLICFDKPSGLPTQPTIDNSRDNLYDLGKKFLSKREGRPVYLGLHHRLDRDTSGVVLFSKVEEINSDLSEMFRNHLFEKRYIAVVCGVLRSPQGTIDNFIGEIGKVGKIKKFGTVKSGGKRAITHFSVLKTNKDHSVLEIIIPTGRTHQIRVHLSSIGHPVLGDTLYGNPTSNYPRYFLHARMLEFMHPKTKAKIKVESPLPADFRNFY